MDEHVYQLQKKNNWGCETGGPLKEGEKGTGEKRARKLVIATKGGWDLADDAGKAEPSGRLRKSTSKKTHSRARREGGAGSWGKARIGQTR